LQNLSHVDEIIKIARCPICKSSSWGKNPNDIKCFQCESLFPIREGSVDFFSTQKINYKTPEERFIYERSLKNWGEILHEYALNDVPEISHHSHFINHFGSKHTLFKETVLEIGCGPGFDAQWTAKKYPEMKCYGIDLGKNIEGVAKRDRFIANLHYMRGDAINLPLENEVVDSIISFGVFHHTYAPQKCMDEAYRVLKRGGSICVYLYTNHENNLPKFIGIQVEKLLVNVFALLHIKLGRILCWAMAPLFLIIFSWPGQILKRIPGLKKIGESFPIHWGTSPSSIIGDLQDRLCASINHRFSRNDFQNLFKNSGFTRLEIVTTTEGHFGYAEKF
jgi:SAM-dependent methyltransferase